MHDPRAIANYFIELSIKQNVALNVSKVFKLVYIAHAMNLYLYNEPMIDETAIICDKGILFPTLYNHFKFYGTKIIKDYAYQLDINKLKHKKIESRLSESEVNIIKAIFKKYGNADEKLLSQLIYSPRSFSLDLLMKRKNKMTNDFIKEIFKETFIKAS